MKVDVSKEAHPLFYFHNVNVSMKFIKFAELRIKETI